MAEYHRYVFDVQARRFVGRFDEMYQAEQEKGFDSWHQDDLRHLDRGICLSILQQFNFNRILDVGCGKGAFTQFLKKHNNHVEGVDISPTAITQAKVRYPDIEFRQADVQDDAWQHGYEGEPIDLIICLELISYIENWQALIEKFSRMAMFTLVKLFLPADPIGYVKDIDQLVDVFSKHYEVLHDIRIINTKNYILFGKSLKHSL